MKVIMGLGNPGKEYERTRHNAGFLVVDAVAEKYRVSSPCKASNLHEPFRSCGKKDFQQV